jgi:hypothetical protein
VQIRVTLHWRAAQVSAARENLSKKSNIKLHALILHIQQPNIKKTSKILNIIAIIVFTTRLHEIFFPPD